MNAVLLDQRKESFIQPRRWWRGFLEGFLICVKADCLVKDTDDTACMEVKGADDKMLEMVFSIEIPWHLGSKFGENSPARVHLAQVIKVDATQYAAKLTIKIMRPPGAPEGDTPVSFIIPKGFLINLSPNQ